MKYTLPIYQSIRLSMKYPLPINHSISLHWSTHYQSIRQLSFTEVTLPINQSTNLLWSTHCKSMSQLTWVLIPVIKKFVRQILAMQMSSLPMDSSKLLTGRPRSSRLLVIWVKSETRRVTGSLTGKCAKVIVCYKKYKKRRQKNPRDLFRRQFLQCVLIL